MMTFFARSSTIVLLAGAALAPLGAHAADRFSVISIANETNANITIKYQWGGPWQSKFLAPGAHEWFSYEYSKPDQDASPDFIASFDANSRAGVAYHEEKKLHGFRAPEQNYDLGHKYVFRYNGPSKTYIELYDVGKK